MGSGKCHTKMGRIDNSLWTTLDLNIVWLKLRLISKFRLWGGAAIVINNNMVLQIMKFNRRARIQRSFYPN